MIIVTEILNISQNFLFRPYSLHAPVYHFANTEALRTPRKFIQAINGFLLVGNEPQFEQSCTLSYISVTLPGLLFRHVKDFPLIESCSIEALYNINSSGSEMITD